MIPDIKLLFKMLLTVAPPNSGNRSQVYNPKGLLLFFYELRRAYIKHRCATMPARRAFLCEVASAPARRPAELSWQAASDLEVTEAAAATATVS
jgi:hypothetical protein